jgi:hypothetical protein
MKTGNYRTLNDRSLGSSKYHKLEATAVRVIMKREASVEVAGRDEACLEHKAYAAEEGALTASDMKEIAWVAESCRQDETSTAKQGKGMKIIDATPNADFPKQVSVMDRDLATRYPDKAFYVRVAKNNGDVSIVELGGEMALPGAVRAAHTKGYKPTHWMETSSGFASKIPSSIVVK